MRSESANGLLSVIEVTLRHKRVVAASAIGATILTVIYALLASPVYRAQVVLIPVEDDGLAADLDAFPGQLGGLASLVGLSTPRAQTRVEGLATLRSRDFAAKFIDDEKLLPVLFYKKWDAANKRWRSSNPDKQPTMADAVLLFDRSIRRVQEDVKTGVISISIDWGDRLLAAQWANSLAVRLNQTMRTRAMREAQNSIEYLNRELVKAERVEVQSAINRLLEAQIKRRMLASVRQQFAFKVIDPATPPDADQRERPKRKLIVLAGLAAGLLAGVLIAILLEAPGRRRRSTS